MMTDFYISEVNYDSERQRIEKVKIRKDKFSSDSINSRQFIVELINSGKVSFKTLIKKNNVINIGEDVRVSGDYLTTDPNNTTKDNLGSLPEFKV